MICGEGRGTRLKDWSVRRYTSQALARFSKISKRSASLSAICGHHRAITSPSTTWFSTEGILYYGSAYAITCRQG